MIIFNDFLSLHIENYCFMMGMAYKDILGIVQRQDIFPYIFSRFWPRIICLVYSIGVLIEWIYSQIKQATISSVVVVVRFMI